LILFNRTQSPRIRETLQQEAIATKSPVIATLEKIDEAARAQITELAYQVVVKMTQDIAQATTLPIDAWHHCLEELVLETSQKMLPDSINWMRILVEQKDLQVLSQPDARRFSNMQARVEREVVGPMIKKISELETLEQHRIKQQSMRSELAAPRKEQEAGCSHMTPSHGIGGTETD